MANVTIVTENNSYGLTRDAVLLANALNNVSVETVAGRDFGALARWFPGKRSRVAIHLQRPRLRWVGSASKNWLVPNQEWFPRRDQLKLASMNLVLAKTRHAAEIFSRLSVPTIHIGFASEDRLDPTVAKNWSRFFHLAGGSKFKGTEEILALWSKHPEWPELVLVQKADNAPRRVPANVKLMSGYIPDADLKRLQNECGIHLCLSRSEGWGHYILEGMSCSAVVVTVDAPPMNEHITEETGVLVPYSHSEPRHLGTNYFVDTGALEAAIERCLGLSIDDARTIGDRARVSFRDKNAAFKERMIYIASKIEEL